MGENNKEMIALSAMNGQNYSEDEDQSIECGYGFYRPQSLQKYRTARWVLFWLCWAGAVQGFIVNGCVNVVITSIEKRYKMKSTESGLIAGAYDIGTFLFLAPVSYYGGTRSKPLFISVGILIMGLGAVVFSLPHLTAGKYEFSQEVDTICSTNQTNNFCSNKASDENLSSYKWIFFLGQFLHGVGATPLYTLGCTYLDESLPTKQSSLYLGIFYSMAILGPTVGYVLGGQMLQWLYVDWISVDPQELGLNNTSPVWVGAWYIVFIFGFLLSLIICVPISLFPKELPDTKRIRSQKISEAHSIHDKTDTTNENFGQTIKDLPKSLGILLCNPTFMFLNLTGATEGMVLSALASFLPKIIEQQFSLATSSAALLVGLVSIPGAGGGTFLGGYLVNRYDLKLAAILKFCIMCALISVGLSSAFVISCPNVDFAGITTTYFNQSTTSITIDSECNSNCLCSDHQYDPVCGLNNQMFYSACYAGCQQVFHSGNSKYYSNCRCLQTSNTTFEDNYNSIEGNKIEAQRNKCETQCKHLPLFLLLIFLCEFFAFLIAMPSLTATLRSVADTQKSFALGIQWMAVRLFGTIPAPLIFGSLIDLSCILWQKSCDKSSGACLLYDNKMMARNILIIVIILKVLSFCFLYFSWLLYKSPQNDDNNSPQNVQTIDLNSDSSAPQLKCCPKKQFN